MDFSKFKEILHIGLDINLVYILEAFNGGTDIRRHIQSEKIEGWVQTLIRKEFLKEDGGLTLSGKELLSSLHTEGRSFRQITQEVKREVTDSFELWWKAYPATDAFVYKSEVFKGSRSFRVKKPECKVKFNKILNEGEYKAEEMINALLMEVEQKKEESFRSKGNKLKYLPNSLTYLNQRGFEGFIELGRNTVLVEKIKKEGEAKDGYITNI